MCYLSNFFIYDFVLIQYKFQDLISVIYKPKNNLELLNSNLIYIMTLS